MRATKHIPKVAVVLAALLAASASAVGAETLTQGGDLAEPVSDPSPADAPISA